MARRRKTIYDDPKPQPKTLTIHDGGSFESVGEFADYAYASPNKTTSAWTGEYTTHVEATFEDAVRLAHEGWKVHRTAFEQASARFEMTSHATSRFGTVYDTTGGWVDVDRFLSGEPECMVQPVLVDDKPILRVCVNLAFSWRSNPKEIAESGGTVTGLIDVATASGYAVELTAVFNCMDLAGRSIHRVFVKVKPSDQPLDIDSVAFALSHSDMLRRFKWAVTDQGPYTHLYGNDHAYGYHFDKENEGTVHPETGEPFDLFVPSLANPREVMTQLTEYWAGMREEV